MLKFVAITPNSPLLIPEIGKENTAKFKSTIQAYREMEENLYATEIDTLIIIARDENSIPAPVINFSPAYHGDFSDFGNFSLKPSYSGDIALTEELKKYFLTDRLMTTTIENLDYQILVPLHFLLAHKKEIKIIPLWPRENSENDGEQNFNFGKKLCEALIDSNKRIGLIATMQTSKQLNKNSSQGYSLKAKKLDQKIIELVKKQKYEDLLAMNIRQARAFGFNEITSLLLLAGALSKVKHKITSFAYEYPFGIGSLAVNFRV